MFFEKRSNYGGRGLLEHDYLTENDMLSYHNLFGTVPFLYFRSSHNPFHIGYGCVYMVDFIDRSILDMLIRNCRASYSDIGRILNLTPSAIKKRVERLEETGVIKSYTVKLNHKLLGKNISALVSVEGTPQTISDLIKLLSRMNFVESIYRISSNNSIVAKYRSKNLDELRQMIDNTLSNKEGIKKYSAELIMDEIKVSL